MTVLPVHLIWPLINLQCELEYNNCMFWTISAWVNISVSFHSTIPWCLKAFVSMPKKKFKYKFSWRPLWSLPSESSWSIPVHWPVCEPWPELCRDGDGWRLPPSPCSSQSTRPRSQTSMGRRWGDERGRSFGSVDGQSCETGKQDGENYQIK